MRMLRGLPRGEPSRPATIETAVHPDGGLVSLLEEQVLELRGALEDAAEAICRTDASGRLISVNRAFTEMLGYAAPEILGRSWQTVIAAHDRALVSADLEAGIRAKIERQAVGLRRDGTSFAMHLVLVPLFSRRDHHDAVQGHYFYIRDLTERRRTEEQLIFAGRMAAVGTLAAGVAHEINNPLTTILGLAQLLLSRADVTPAVHERIALMADEASRAAGIVQNLLMFARHYPPERRPCSLVDAVQRVIALKSYQLELDKVRVTTELDHAPIVWADENQMQQVLLNLVQNAHQAMARQEGERVLTVRLRPRDRHVAIEVLDSGPGIPASLLSRIFDPFFTTKPPGEGSGLGLSVSYGIVGQHGGRLYAENRPEGGAMFVVELPTGERA